jgi:hypothetical protein
MGNNTNYTWAARLKIVDLNPSRELVIELNWIWSSFGEDFRSGVDPGTGIGVGLSLELIVELTIVHCNAF